MFSISSVFRLGNRPLLLELYSPAVVATSRFKARPRVAGEGNMYGFYDDDWIISIKGGERYGMA